MSHSRAIPTLHVEGRDDLYTIAELLRRHGVDMSEPKRPFTILPAKDPATSVEGVGPLLANMADAIRNATDRPVGFVLDVDVKTGDRWSAVSAKLKAAGVVPPGTCPPNGYFGQVPGYPHRVGVWMMPDCVKDHGKLEHLLETLMPANDPVWPLAETSTDQAKKLGAGFRDVDRQKAVVHCWLAWQKDPGVPFGTAINAKFLGCDSPEARAFVRWLRDLYNLQGLQNI